MPVPLSLPSVITRYSPVAGAAVKRFRRQPSLLSTASRLVGQALLRLQPPVEADPGSLALAWPLTGGAEGELNYVVLPELLIDLFVRETALTVVPGYQTLIQKQGAQWTELAVDLQCMAQELDAVRPTLIESFEEALALFWSETDSQGETHWRWMADYARASFIEGLHSGRSAETLPMHAYEAGLTVATWRKNEAILGQRPADPVRVYLLQIQEGDTALPFDARLDPQLLVSFTGDGQGDDHLLFSQNGGLRYFPSTRALRDAIDAMLSRWDGAEDATLQRVEATGDVFCALARSLLQTQLIQLSGVTGWVRMTESLSATSLLKASSDVVTGFFQIDARRQERNARDLQRALPDWLRRAPAVDRWHFAGALAQLALSWPQVTGSWFLHDIPTLEAYVYQRLRDEAARLHPEGPALVPEHLVLTLVSVVPDPIAVTGGPSEPHFLKEALSVTALAIDNLTAHEAAWLDIAARPGTTVPAWLNEDELKALVRAIDVGEQYPAMLRRRLVEGPESQARQTLFGHQVTLQLPLLAWELMLRGECAMDRDGYQLVEEGLGALPTPEPAHLVGLGVTAGAQYGVDIIAGTYLFTRDTDPSAPCVLYRPLHAKPLRQFSSLDALWDELCAPGELQESALLWMTDLGRSRYSRGGLREPRVARFGQGDEFAPLQVPSPARPVLVPLAAPRLHTLYEQVVKALIDMAERRSVSNAEDRWVSLGHLAQTLFTGLMPVLNGPLATAGWLVQLSDAFNVYLNTLDQSQSASAAARTNLLFSVAMLLLSEAVHWPVDEPERLQEPEPSPGGAIGDGAVDEASEPPEAPAPQPPRPVAMLGWAETAVAEAKAVSRPLDLDLSWSAVSLVPSPTQTQALAALRASPPSEPLSPIPHGPYQGLYLDDRQWLMKWQHNYYAVSVEDVDLRIVGPEGQEGPFIRRDEAGRWALDLRLRLRGGGPKRRIEARRHQNEVDRQQGERLYAEIVGYYESLRTRANSVAERVEHASQHDEPAMDDREALDKLLREGHEHGAQLISAYEGLNKATPLTDYAERICEVLARQLHISRTITDNLSQLSRLCVQDSPYLKVSEKALNELVLRDPAGWVNFIERYRDLTEQSLIYVQLHHDTVRQIEAIPRLGARTLEHNARAVDTFHSPMELRSSLAYCELGLVMEPLRGNPALAEQVHRALEPLLVHGTSHADLIADPSATPQQTMEVLDTALHHYQRVEDALRVFKELLAAEGVMPALERFERIAVAMREDAEARMGELVRSAVTPVVSSASARRNAPRRPRPRPASATSVPRPASSTPQPVATEVIVTAEGESVMAHTHTDHRTQQKVAQVISNGRVLATWRQDSTTGAWNKPAVPVRQPAQGLGARLDSLVAEADKAMRQVREEVSTLARFKLATRVPVEIEDLYHGSARRLEAAAEDIEEALTQLNETDAAIQQRGSAERKAHELRDLAGIARRTGTHARVEISKSLLPTVARLDFLVEQGEVTIRKLGGRTPLGRGGRRDFVQEYEIQDRQRHPLWYAHFHYDTTTSSAERFTAAHLKTVTQRFDGYQKQLQQARDNEEVIGIYRSRIDLTAARRLFLSLP
ncbi:dermonecrotic toxin domain-containing protein [Pseudomonas japonica]|uniref:dermonecrotic toxin domain-containing protein n=1 Tax=Pseudomonas japonica TaxID=256466 RepID=UPI0015E3492F|nr:DUF6543 domain-containing protein [Pseudomonas japonica]MBA1244121.1 hypothetical protein [Pseudomonas japonica]